jgi:hypothetical protein
MPLSTIVIAEANTRFASGDVAMVITSLEGASIPIFSRAAPSELPRIQLAIIKLAAGNIDTFRRALALAEQDWRDVLVAAGLANANWRDVLTEAGMRTP